MMTLQELYIELKKLQLPVQYYMFQEGQAPSLPYIIYFNPSEQHANADNLTHIVAKDVIITICSDDDKVLKSPDNDVFYDNKQTLQTLKQLFDDIEIQEISGSKRFKNGELVHLEQNLFGVPYHKFNGINNNISIYSADNAYDEIENVCKKIFKLVRDKGYRYRDIAVISNNLESYASLVKVIADSYNIPIFMDEKVDITQNVFIKYLISILDIFSKNWSYESVFNYLKTGFVKVDNIVVKGDNNIEKIKTLCYNKR